MRYPRGSIIATSFALFTASLLFLGCSGGHGPSLPSPDRSDVIDTDEFVVEAGETVRYDANTVIQCETARIDGEIIGADGSGPGDPGVSVSIEAAGDITVSDRIVAGSGVVGDSDSAGGDGGSIVLRSTGGDITIGVVSGSEAAATAQVGAAQLVAGDGADGGDGLTGGAGGAGGSITVEAPNGRLTINPSEGLLHRGNGGSGGRGVVAGQDILNFDPETELSNSGGDGGRLVVDCEQLEGVELVEAVETYEGAPVFVAWLDGGTMTGGAGGDGGDFYLGVDPDTGASTWPTGVTPRSVRSAVNGSERVEVRGQDGGDSDSHSGSGSDVRLDFSGIAPPGEGQDGAYVFGRGGDGGDVDIDPSGPLGDAWALFVSRDNISCGAGGSAYVKAPNGSDGGPGQNGGEGGDARAEGGAAGQITASYADYEETMIAFGAPGVAEAYAGHGGDGGDLCVVTQPGGNGGRGGSATAVGGIGPRWNNLARRGGGAMAVGGDGGDGGMGTPPGTGGILGWVTAEGGFGFPSGDAIRRQGTPGEDGEPCPEPEVSYNAAIYAPGHDYQYCSVVRMFSGVFNGFVPRQGGPVVLGNAENNPIRVRAGQTMAWMADGGRMFIGTVDQGVLIYDSPMSGGDRAPNAVLLPNASFQAVSLWYDSSRDQLYAAAEDDVMVWHNASNLSTDAQPNRVIAVGGLGAPTINCITGDANRDILYIAAASRMHALDGASALDGPAPVDRTIITEASAGRSIACDSSRDRLYAGGVDLITQAGHVLTIDAASSAAGDTDPSAVFEVGQGENWPVALQVFPELDELLVGVLFDRLLLFRNASQLTDSATEDAEMPIDLTAFGARRP